MNKTPRVAAVHDMSGLGRCSLTVILPVLSAMGAQCCPLQTAYLSAHTGFPVSDQAAFCDLTDAIPRTMRHWKQLGMSFDAIYSGFLGSVSQIGMLRNFITAFRRRDTLVLIDPVMGDHGEIYRTYTPEMCRRMSDLADAADLITPNLTEASILLEERYEDAPRDEAGLREWLLRLSRKGRRSVVITGVGLASGQIGAAALSREDGSISFPMGREEPGQFSGTGDLFAAVLLGALLRGESLHTAAEQAVNFVHRCAEVTLCDKTPLLDGVNFEGQIPLLLGQ